jgi:hypothetical protein
MDPLHLAVPHPAARPSLLLVLTVLLLGPSLPGTVRGSVPSLPPSLLTVGAHSTAYLIAELHVGV